MALITSCQASFQNVAGYEDDITAIQENVRECYSEISKSSEQIRLAVREDYIHAQKWQLSSRIFNLRLLKTVAKSVWTSPLSQMN